MTDPIDPLQEVPKKALKKLRAICRGNGCAPDSIQIKNIQGELVEFEAFSHIELQTETKNEKISGKVQKGELLENSAIIESKISENLTGAIGNTDARRELAGILMNRPDKGFSIHSQKFPVPALNQEFSIYHACERCGGQSQEECPRCKGVKREICNKCHGKTMVPCQYCGANGTVTGPDGKQIQCNRCFGHKQVVCTYCQKVGTVSCQQCNATGAVRCSNCNGAAFYTEVVKSSVHMRPLFEIDRTTIPNESVKLIEDSGSLLSEKEHFKIEAEQIKRDDGGLAIQYKGSFPYGELDFSINGKVAKCHIIGYHGKFVKLPNILDGLTTPARKLLEQAAKGKGGVLAKIKKASNTRLIGEALQFALLLPRKKAMSALRKKYPIGLSTKAVQHVVQISYLALHNATRQARHIGFTISGVMIAAFNALYFMGPLRILLLLQFKSEPIVSVIDLALIPIGAFLCRLMAQQFAKQPLRKALGSYYPRGKKKRVKMTIDGNVQSYLISVTLFLLCVYGAKLLGQTPAWFPF